MSLPPYVIIDQHPGFIIINKSPGVSFHQEQGEPGLFQLAQSELPNSKLYPVHRLDKVTSGLVIFATTPEGAAEFGELFAQRNIEKYYLALSSGKPSKKQGSIIGDMEKARRGAWKLTRTSQNPAITQFKSYGTQQGVRLFLVKPLSGKTHQIRVALKSLGSPILGDSLYGCQSTLPTDRTYLHAYCLRFNFQGQVFTYCHPPTSGQHFELSDIKQLLATDLNAPWKINFPAPKTPPK